MRDKNIALRETDIETGRNSQEDLLTTEISSHSKGNNYFAESIRTEEVDAVVHFAGESGEEEKAAFQDGQDFFTRRSNRNEANSRNSSNSLCRTKQL